MIRFTTENSKYEVTVQQNRFHVKKFEATHPGTNIMVVGDTSVSWYFDIGLGKPAHFGGMRTSTVVSIDEV